MSLYFIDNTSSNSKLRSDGFNSHSILKNWDHFTCFGSLYFFKKTYRANDFSNYFVLATRGNVMVTSAKSIRDLFCRIYGFFKLQPECLKWLFTRQAKFTNLARWFGWKTGSDIFIQLDRQTIVFCTADFCYGVHSRYISYKFLYYIGCDVAFVMSSFRDDGRYLDFQDKGIPTIGFDDGTVNAYTYGFPGGTGYITVLTYLRVLVVVLAEVRIGHKFWHLQANKYVI